MSFTQKILIPLSNQVDTSFLEHRNIFESEGDRIALLGESDFFPTMTANNAPSPYVVSASSEFATLQTWRACDNNFTGISNSWATNSVTSGWWKIDLGSGNDEIAKVYTITCLDHATGPARAPKDWTFEGSNTGAFAGEETILDTQSGITDWTQAEKKSYPFSNLTSFRYYRWNITANNGDATFLQIQEFEAQVGFFTNSPSPVAVWTAIPIGAEVDMSTAKCWMFKDDVVQAAGNTDIKFKFAINNGALSASKTLTELRAESDPTITDAANSFKAVGVYASDGSYESKSSAWLEVDVVFPENGGGGRRPRIRRHNV